MPDCSRVDESCFTFHTSILQGLKSSGVDAHLYVPFYLDVWQYLMNGKGVAVERGTYLFQKEDFDMFAGLPSHWWYYMNQHGTGRVIDFSLKIRPFLSQTSTKDFVVGGNETIVKAPILYTEKLSIHFVKRACNANNI